MATEIWCKSCGERCGVNDNYCPVCHASLKAQDHSAEMPLDGINIDLWYKFIGKNADGYVRGFIKNKGKKYYIDFNPAAWFFPTYWFAYRRMFGKAVLLQVLASFLSALLVVFSAKSYTGFGPFLLGGAISWLLPIVVGLFANSIYRQHIIKKLKKPIPEIDAGGTSTGAIIGWYFLSSVISNGSLLIFLLIAMKVMA